MPPTVAKMNVRYHPSRRDFSDFFSGIQGTDIKVMLLIRRDRSIRSIVMVGGELFVELVVNPAQPCCSRLAVARQTTSSERTIKSYYKLSTGHLSIPYNHRRSPLLQSTFYPMTFLIVSL